MFYKGGGPSCGSPARSRRSLPPYGTRRRAPDAPACRPHLSKRSRRHPPGTDIFAVERRTVGRRRRTRPTAPANVQNTSRTPRVDRRKCGRSGAGTCVSSAQKISMKKPCQTKRVSEVSGDALGVRASRATQEATLFPTKRSAIDELGRVEGGSRSLEVDVRRGRRPRRAVDRRRRRWWRRRPARRRRRRRRREARLARRVPSVRGHVQTRHP